MVTCNEIYDMYQHRNPESEIHQAFREVATDDKDSMYDNRTPLHLACHFADVEAVRILLDRGAEINDVNILHCPLWLQPPLQDRMMKTAEPLLRHCCSNKGHGCRGLHRTLPL